MDWRESNLGINDLDHYRQLYAKTMKRNPMAADQTFRATVGRFVGPSEGKAIDTLLQEVKGQQGQNSMAAQR